MARQKVVTIAIPVERLQPLAEALVYASEAIKEDRFVPLGEKWLAYRVVNDLRLLLDRHRKPTTP